MARGIWSVELKLLINWGRGKWGAKSRTPRPDPSCKRAYLGGIEHNTQSLRNTQSATHRACTVTLRKRSCWGGWGDGSVVKSTDSDSSSEGQGSIPIHNRLVTPVLGESTSSHRHRWRHKTPNHIKQINLKKKPLSLLIANSKKNQLPLFSGQWPDKTMVWEALGTIQ